MSTRKPFITRPCEGCGKEITGASNRLKWCEDCRVERRREIDREAKRRQAAREKQEQTRREAVPTMKPQPQKYGRHLKCSVDACEKYAVKGYLCTAHYKERHGGERPFQKSRCKVADCRKQAAKGGYCKRHWNEQQAALTVKEIGPIGPVGPMNTKATDAPDRPPALFLIFEGCPDLYHRIEEMAVREYRTIQEQALYLLDRGTLFTPVPLTGLDTHPVVDKVTLARDLLPFIKKELANGR